MKLFQIALYTSLALCSASAAFAQYGLYGSPDVLQMPQQNAAGQYATPAGYPTTATPMAERLPGPAYYQPSAATYQPYQPGAQYRYPRPYPLRFPQPYVRRPTRLTVARQQGPLQPIPAPPVAPAASAPRPAPVYAPPSVPRAQRGPGMMAQAPFALNRSEYLGNAHRKSKYVIAKPQAVSNP